MKYNIVLKFTAIALCALSLVIVVASGLGIVLASEQGLYANTPEEVLSDQQQNIALSISDHYGHQYAIENLGNLPQELIDHRWGFQYQDYFIINYDFDVEIWDGEECVSALTSGQPENVNTFEFTNIFQYAVVTDTQTYPFDEYAGEFGDTSMTEPADVMPVVIRQADEPLYTDTYSITSHDENGVLVRTDYQLAFYNSPEYRIAVKLDGDTSYNDMGFLLLPLYQFRFHLIGAVVLGLLLFAVTLVYLCCAAGRKAGTTEVRPMGLNRVPLDLYAACAVAGCALLIWGGVELSIWIFNNGEDWALLTVVALCVYVAGLLAIGWVFAFAAQVKSKGGYWWRHMILGACLNLVLRFFRWIGGGLTWARNGIRAVFNLLPVIWQWLITGALMAAVPLVLFLLCIASYGIGEVFWGFLLMVSIVADVIIVCYGAYCFGTLLKGARHMSQGNLDHNVPTRHLFGAFRDFGQQLNSLAEGAKIAAERQMKSERMKTELITNVSHDIKTPLTSIINYVDLMKKPHTPRENDQYLDVLDRQSQRLKKLIEDLMEMSKASTGNMAVELIQLDAVEAVNQALGEFSDKLAKVGLTPVFRHPEEPVIIQADGRLVWRVLSNILSNAVKYALPDTRLYLDLMVLQGNAVIAIKNISREQLNVAADELMERFVRGDSSRNTEGSGLGLNIAKSLVELQQGQMHLMVDGDLFKVTLIFPLSE